MAARFFSWDQFKPYTVAATFSFHEKNRCKLCQNHLCCTIFLVKSRRSNTVASPRRGWCWWCVEAFAHNSSSCEGRERRPQRGLGLGSSFVYSWSISHILEHEFFCLGLWAAQGMVFCYQNCSDLLWEKFVLVIQKNFWKLRLKAENFAKILRSLEQSIQTVKGQNNFL